MFAEALKYSFATGDSSGGASVYAEGTLRRFGSGTSSGEASVSADASVAYVYLGGGTSSGAATVFASGFKTSYGAGTSSGSAIVYANAFDLKFGVGDPSSGLATVYAEGTLRRFGGGDSSGSSSVSGDGSVESDPIHYAWTNTWVSPDKLTATDNIPAVVSIPANQGSSRVRARDYNILVNEVPDTAAVSGIELVLHGCQASRYIENCQVYAYLSFETTGNDTNELFVPVVWSTSPQNIVLGNNADTWGLDSPAPSGFRTSGFSAHVWLFNNGQGASANFSIDSASIILYYNYFGG